MMAEPSAVGMTFRRPHDPDRDLTDDTDWQWQEENMSESSPDLGLITVLLERLETQRLPRALSLKERVDRGERLSDADLAFLEEVFADTSKVKPLLDRYPQYQELAARMVNLYKEITAKALENEKASPAQ
jgi:hypothetical protein